MAIADGHGLPIAVYVASASPHEAKLVEPTVQICCARPPKRLIGDLAYDSDPLSQELRQNHGRLIATRKKNRAKPRPRMATLFGAIVGAGKLNGFSLGCTTSAAWLRVGNITMTTLRRGATCLCSHPAENVLPDGS